MNNVGYHFRHSRKATKGAFPKIMISDLRSFPIPEIDNDNTEYAKSIVYLVNEISEEKIKDDPNDTQIKFLESQIDNMVFRLYGLTDDDISLII